MAVDAAEFMAAVVAAEKPPLTKEDSSPVNSVPKPAPTALAKTVSTDISPVSAALIPEDTTLDVAAVAAD